MTPIVKEGSAASKGAVRPRVLVVDDEPTLVELIGEIVSKDVNCWMISARNLGEARQILATQPIELLVTDVHLPDGDGMSLIPSLRQHQPQASAIVMTGSPSVDGAINALRSGALDFVPKPFSAQHLAERVRKALERQAAIAKTEKRLVRLRDAVKRLNEARKVVTKKVDLLCNDLISAYGEVAKQLDVVRTQEGFRKYLENAGDLEQLLCHAMDWVLRQLGYSNVAIWLASDDTEFQLGAYMKYTIPGEQALTDAIKKGLLPMVVKEGSIHLTADEVQEKLTPAELDFLADQHVVGINCTYLGEPLAAVILFRDGKTGFTEEDVAALKSISAIFAVALAETVRKTGGEEGAEGGTPEEEEGYKPFLDEDSEKRRPRGKKKDDADWWKRGEPPPF